MRIRRGCTVSSLAIVRGAGHMVHHAAPDGVISAVDGLEMPHLEPAKRAA
jgi:pimeloyl-ACP methyl ester carboxylesterase